MKFQDVLGRLMDSRNYTYRDLANELNKKYEVKFTKSTLQNWREGKSSPSIYHANALADFFDITLDELADRVDLPKQALEPDTSEVIAAHIDDNVSEEEMDEILRFIDFIKSKQE